MIAASQAPVRVPPLIGEGAHWLVRPGTLFERAELEADLAGRDAGQVHFFELEAEINAACQQLLPEAMRGRVMEIVAQLRAGDIAAEPDRQLWAGIEEQLLAGWPAYARLIRRAARREQLLPVLAARRFLIGREGEEPLPRDHAGMVTDAALEALNPYELRYLGARAYGLLYVDKAAQDFLSQPSGADAGPPSSRGRRKGGAAAAG